jgi:alpha-beta hydrolase superfamily lysophospholipase
MVHDESYFESHDGTRLYLYRWAPEQPPKAVLHIVHGMAEHALRYKILVEKFTDAGIEVWAADQRGHGYTANLDVNKKSAGGLLGHCADKGSFALIAKDIYTLNNEIIKTKGVPVFLLGHSWGSFNVQNYIEEYSNDLKIAGCILSGTKGPGDPMVKVGIPFLTVLAALCGQRKGSRLAKGMADGQYNKKFKPNRTEFDWLSRDEKEVDKFVSDPLCGQLCSLGFYRDLAKLLNQIHKEESLAKIKPDLPIYVFSGSADPVGDMGISPAALVNKYRELGIKDVELTIYKGARHETLNETNREEVIDNLLKWINKRCE